MGDKRTADGLPGEKKTNGKAAQSDLADGQAVGWEGWRVCDKRRLGKKGARLPATNFR